MLSQYSPLGLLKLSIRKPIGLLEYSEAPKMDYWPNVGYNKKVVICGCLENMSSYVALGQYSHSISPEFIIYQVFPDDFRIY